MWWSLNALAISVRWLLGIAVLATIVVAINAGLQCKLNRDKLLVVQTSSMQPVLKPGDAIVAKPCSWQQLRIGEIVSYRSLENKSIIVSHRIVAINHYNGSITTKGDALIMADPEFTPDRLVGQVTAVAPKFGSLLEWMRRPIGLATIVYMPALITVISQLKRLIDANHGVHYIVPNSR